VSGVGNRKRGLSVMAIKKETESAEKQLDRFLDAYTPEVAEIARKALMKLRKRLPFATEMVYDNYNALACGFGPSERVSDVVFSIAVYPKHVNFFFLQGATLPDPEGLLQGGGSRVRHIRLEDEKTLDRSDVKAMMASAMKMAKAPFDEKAEYKLVIKSVSAKRRPRRPKGRE
jgi:hypothetical protein